MVRGYKIYECCNDSCTHVKHISFSCHSRFCPTCGKKATDVWVAKQMATLPQTDWQHITFTVPDKLWPTFQQDRELLNQFAKLAADCIQTTAKKLGINVAIFTALHTFGRDLKWHVHLHLSVTMGGLTKDNTAWKSIRFSKKIIMPMWRYRIIKMMRKALKEKRIDVTKSMLEVQYHKNWVVHFAKPTKNAWRTVSYLGRYLKKPPLSQSRLEHYDGKKVTFEYLNHRTGKHQTTTFDKDEFIQRFTQHIPDKHFCSIRYYGVLANRVRSKLLPIVYELLEQEVQEAVFIGFSGLMQKNFGVNPLQCVLCKSKLRLTGLKVGLSSPKLQKYHYEIATRKAIRA